MGLGLAKERREVRNWVWVKDGRWKRVPLVALDGRDGKGTHLDELKPDFKRITPFLLLITPLSIPIILLLDLPPLRASRILVHDDLSAHPRRSLPLLRQVPRQHPLALHEALARARGRRRLERRLVRVDGGDGVVLCRVRDEFRSEGKKSAGRDKERGEGTSREMQIAERHVLSVNLPYSVFDPPFVASELFEPRSWTQTGAERRARHV